MRESLIRFVVRFYPASWRNRYGLEFDALLEDVNPYWRDIGNVLLGALQMQMKSWSFRNIAAGLGIAGALFGAMLSFTIHETYVSSAELRVTMREAPMIDKTADKVLSDLWQTATSRVALAEVIEGHGLYPRERATKGMDGAIERMRRDFSIEPAGRTLSSQAAFRIAFRYGDATQAQRIAEELIRRLMVANVMAALARNAAGSDSPVENLYVPNPATFPKQPSGPNRLLVAAMGLAAGLLLGAAIAVVARLRRHPSPA